MLQGSRMAARDARQKGHASIAATGALLAAAPFAAWSETTHDVEPGDLADEQGRVTRLQVGVEADGSGASGAFASIAAPLTPKDTLSISLGRTEFDDLEIRDRTIETEPAERLALYYRHQFDRMGFTAGAERWGNNDNLEIDDLSVGIDFLTERSDWSLDFIGRSSTVTIDGLPSRRIEHEVDAWGVSAGFGHMTDPLDLYLSLLYFDYGDTLDAGGPLVARFGTQSALSVADALLDRSVVAGGIHDFRVWSAGFEAGWYRGGISGVETRILSGIFEFPIGSRTRINLSLGGYDSDDQDNGFYGSLSLRCALGGRS